MSPRTRPDQSSHTHLCTLTARGSARFLSCLFHEALDEALGVPLFHTWAGSGSKVGVASPGPHSWWQGAPPFNAGLCSTDAQVLNLPACPTPVIKINILNLYAQNCTRLCPLAPGKVGTTPVGVSQAGGLEPGRLSATLRSHGPEGTGLGAEPGVGA